MKQEIVNAIAAYLEEETKVTGFRNNRHRVEFGGTLNRAHFTHAGFCQEIAQEIAAKIDPLLPKAVGWEDAPPWAKWRAIDENENIAYSLDFPSANTKMEVPKGFTSTVKVERRPNDQTPSPIR